MPTVRLFKLGHSVVMTIPRSIMEHFRLFVGDTLQMEVRPKHFRLTPTRQGTATPAAAGRTDGDLSRAVTEDEE